MVLRLKLIHCLAIYAASLVLHRAIQGRLRRVHGCATLGYFRLFFFHFQLAAKTFAQLLSDRHFVCWLSLHNSNAFLCISITVLRCTWNSWLFVVGRLLVNAVTKILIRLF